MVNVLVRLTSRISPVSPEVLQPDGVFPLVSLGSLPFAETAAASASFRFWLCACSMEVCSSLVGAGTCCKDSARRMGVDGERERVFAAKFSPPDLGREARGADAPGVGRAVGDGLGVARGAGLGNDVGLGMGDGTGLGVGDGVGDGMGVGLGVGVGVGVGSGVGLGVGVGRGVGRGVGCGVGVGFPGPGVGLGVGIGVGGSGVGMAKRLYRNKSVRCPSKRPV